MKRLFICLLIVFAASAEAHAQAPLNHNAAEIRQLIREAVARKSGSMTIRFRENAIAMGHVPVDFPERAMDAIAANRVQGLREQISIEPPVFLIESARASELSGDVSWAGDEEFELETSAGKKMRIAYSDVASASLRLPQPMAGPRAESPAETMVILPFRLIRILILGDWCGC